MITITEKIKMAAAREGLSIAELARLTGKKRQNLHAQLSQNDMMLSEAEKLVRALGAELEAKIVFSDGESI